MYRHDESFNHAQWACPYRDGRDPPATGETKSEEL